MADSTTYSVNNLELSAYLKLDNSVTELPQVSDARKSALSSLGIFNVRDLINYFPRDYIDLSSVSTILDSKIGFNYTITGIVHSLEEKEPKPGIKLIEITILDDTGTMIVTAFNQKWLLESVKPKDKVAVAGKIEFNYGFKRMTNPFIYVLNEDTTATDIAKVIPIYTSNKNISSAWIKRIISNAFEYVGNLNSIIPKDLEEKYRLLNYFVALKKCHFPADMKDLESAKRTIRFAEVLMQQINFMDKDENCQNNFIYCEFGKDKINKACQALSLYKDSGKQSLMIVPSSIVMEQYKFLLNESLSKLHVTFQIIDENSSKENIWKATYDFNNADCDVLIATSALLEHEFSSINLGLIIVDEKTEFSRDEILKIKKFSQDVDKLYLSSKPITKTMAKLIYPECECTKVSYKEFKKCNVKIYNKDDNAVVYQECLKHTYHSNQVLIVCPLVGLNYEQRNAMAGISKDEYNIEMPAEKLKYNVVSIDNKLDYTKDNSESAKKKFQFFENQIFSECSSALIYEQMPAKEKIKILQQFEEGKIEVLVCACQCDFMVRSKNKLQVIVEDADRIGLSSLHQIRNFIVEKFEDSNLYLITSSKIKTAVKRLNLMSEIMDGESLVERDLALRQDGASLGLSNFGFDKLKLINIVRDKVIIETANKDAKEILNKDLNLKKEENKLLSYEISRTFKD